ncbi:MAG: hypothetical protein R3C20_07730 [Planctomycetaceae bacterium]
MPEQFKLAASPNEGDAEGKSSRFTLDSSDLVTHIEDASSEASLNVTINDTPYSGSLAHSHEENEHGHGHTH